MKTFLLSLSVVALTATGVMADEIRVLNWQGYGTDQDFAVKPFEKATGIKIVHEYFNSEQEMLTKLRTNPGAYDVVLINSTFTQQAESEGLLSPIDTSALSNFDGIPDKFAKDPKLMIDGKEYGVPWAWGLTSFAINTQSIDKAPDSIEALWDPKYKGHVAFRDDAIEAMQMGALATGQDINDIKDLDAVKKKLSELLPNLLTFWGSENDWNQYMASGQMDIGTYWSGSAARSIAAGLPIEFIVPKEGAIGWLDGLSIPATSTHKEDAEKFINWMIDPEFYKAWDKEGAPASANSKAMDALPEDSFNRRVLGNPEVAKRVQFQAPVDNATKEKYLEIWQSLKAAQ